MGSWPRRRTGRHLVIVGAGFSAAAGLPLASGFTEALLDTTRLARASDNLLLVRFLQKFVDDVFGAGNPVGADYWPQLEDLFTTIDLAANSGHNLGREYPPAKLRTVRRALIVRTVRMLQLEMERGQSSTDPQRVRERTLLQEMLHSVPLGRTSFLSMNWDTVIEDALLSPKRARGTIDYGCDAQAAKFVGSGIVIDPAPALPSLTLLKPHGSINWMYCDCCSQLLWFPPWQARSVAARLFTERDRETVARVVSATPTSSRSVPCPACAADALGTRFATFSYRKALDFPMHLATWRAATRALREADTWTFIGYSMPAADYEFKQLLKRVHLARSTPPKITLITGGSRGAETIRAYGQYLGNQALSSVFEDGIDQAAISHLRRIGVLEAN